MFTESGGWIQNINQPFKRGPSINCLIFSMELLSDNSLEVGRRIEFVFDWISQIFKFQLIKETYLVFFVTLLKRF